MKLQVPVTDTLHSSIVKAQPQVLALIKALPRRETTTQTCELHLCAELVRKRPNAPDAGPASRLSLRNIIARPRPVSRTWKHVFLGVGDRKAEISSRNTKTHTATGRMHNN